MGRDEGHVTELSSQSPSEHSYKHDTEKHGNVVSLQPVTTLDVEAENAQIGDATFEEQDLMKQGLQQRHIQMIALAGAIGTGLFLSSGRAIAHAGPVGALLAYIVMGLGVASVVLVVGEMGALIPLSGGVVRYAEYFVDPSMAFANGWNQVYGYAVSVPSEMVAAAVLVQFWNQELNSAIFITVFSVIVLISALLFVRVYGEIEFVSAMLKIMLIVGINVMALVITCGGGPDHKAIGFEYWRNPGPFHEYLGVKGPLGNFLGFWVTMNTALYAYSGAQNISLAAAETKNPRRNIPRAAKRIFVRVFVFYVLTIFMVGLVVPSNDKHITKWTGTASMSPFVVAARRAGIKVVPSIINAVIITSAWSSGSSNMLGGPRTLFGLARHGHAPKVFLKLNRFGIPWVATLFVGAFMCLGYMTLSNSAATVFNWLQDLVAISTLVNYILILIIYLRLYYAAKKQGIDRKSEFPWAAPFQPYASWFSLVLFIILFWTSGFATFLKGNWSTETFVSSYINLPVVAAMYFIHKWVKGTRYKRLHEVPIREFIDHANAHPEPPPHPKKGIHKLNFLWG